MTPTCAWPVTRGGHHAVVTGQRQAVAEIEKLLATRDAPGRPGHNRIGPRIAEDSLRSAEKAGPGHEVMTSRGKGAGSLPSAQACAGRPAQAASSHRTELPPSSPIRNAGRTSRARRRDRRSRDVEYGGSTQLDPVNGRRPCRRAGDGEPVHEVTGRPPRKQPQGDRHGQLRNLSGNANDPGEHSHRDQA